MNGAYFSLVTVCGPICAVVLTKRDNKPTWHLFPCLGRFERTTAKGWKNLVWAKMRASGSRKLGSKIVQVKGVMPPEGGITRETPTGRAVGGFAVWHNFFLI